MRTSLVVLLICGASAVGQTATDLKFKCGKPMEVYAVSEHIWMTPEYTSDGQICFMSFFPRRLAGNTSLFEQTLRFEELREVLNTLVPIDKRGAKDTHSFGATATGGGFAWTTFGYERVRITFTLLLPSRGYDSSDKLKRGEFAFNFPKEAYDKAEDSAASEDDFRHSEESKSNMVTVAWRGRKCAGT